MSTSKALMATSWIWYIQSPLFSLLLTRHHLLFFCMLAGLWVMEAWQMMPLSQWGSTFFFCWTNSGRLGISCTKWEDTICCPSVFNDNIPFFEPNFPSSSYLISIPPFCLFSTLIELPRAMIFHFFLHHRLFLFSSLVQTDYMVCCNNCIIFLKNARLLILSIFLFNSPRINISTVCQSNCYTWCWTI
jgi:hypothetical protein